MRARGKMERRRQNKGVKKTKTLLWVAGSIGLVVVMAALGIISNLGGDGGGGDITSSDPEQIGPLEVSATRIDLGQVPPNRWVNPTFHLSNTSEKPVTITIPRQGVEVLEGC